jgi:hypothetical protein
MPLRPLGLGDLYDTSIKAVQADPRNMVGIPALVVSILSLLLFIPDLFQLRSFTIYLPESDGLDSVPSNELLFSGQARRATLEALEQHVGAVEDAERARALAVALALGSPDFQRQ